MTISIILPTYNSSRFIERTLASVAEQTVLPDEVLVVDDGSTDSTIAQVEEWRARQRFEVRILPNTVQHDPVAGRGPAAGRQSGLAAARGEFVALLDHDDEMLPRHLELTSSALHQHPDLVLCFGDAIERTQQGQERRLLQDASGLQLTSFERRTGGLSVNTSSFVPAILKGSFIATAGNLWRREAARTIGGFSTAAGTCDDWLFFMSLSCVGRVGYFQEAIARKHAHDGNLSHPRHTLRSLWNFFDALNIFAEQADALNVSSDDRSAVAAWTVEVSSAVLYTSSRAGLPTLRQSAARLSGVCSPTARDWLRAGYFSVVPH